jgi:hypothetical protein
MTRAKRFTELGEEIQCARCREFWPSDTEFFFFSNGKPHSWCKDCYMSDPKTVQKRLRAQEREKVIRNGHRHIPTPGRPIFNALPLYAAIFGHIHKGLQPHHEEAP